MNEAGASYNLEKGSFSEISVATPILPQPEQVLDRCFQPFSVPKGSQKENNAQD